VSGFRDQGSLLLSGVKTLDGPIIDIRACGGIVVEIGECLAPEQSSVIHARGLLLIPGLVDLCCHSGSACTSRIESSTALNVAATRGGYTAIFWSTDGISDTSLGASDHGSVQMHRIAPVSPGRRGQGLADPDDGAPVRLVGDVPSPISDPLLMRRALETARSFGATVIQHPEEPRLAAEATANEGKVSARLGLVGAPHTAEAAIIARDALLAAEVGGRVHFSGVSTAESVAVLEWAKDRGCPITADVSPMHLVLTEDVIATYETKFKVRPPLRTRADVDAVRGAVASGTIDAIATHHMPRAPEEKLTDWVSAASGAEGLETALGVAAAALLRSGMIGDWDILVDRMSLRPAAIAGLEGYRKTPLVGAAMTFVLIDPEADWTAPASTASGLSSPFAGTTLAGVVEMVFIDGNVVMRRGELVAPQGPS
jgi:dihydroorotase